MINNSVEIILGDNKNQDNPQPEKKKRGRKPGSTKEKLAAAKQTSNQNGDGLNDESRKENGKKSKRKTDDEFNDDSLIDENDLISADMKEDIRAKRGSIFADIDMTKFNIYDKYYKLLVSIVTHEELYKLGDVPLFLKVPNEQSKFFNDMKNENQGVGYLNFNMILQRLKSKKYGPGKNMIKESDLQLNIRNVFRICERYYNFDPLSMRISKILEEHFEKELAQSPDIKCVKFTPTNSKGDLFNVNKASRKENGLVGGKRGSQIGSNDDDGIDEMSSIHSDDDKKRKRDKKKDKKDKKDKKRKDKKHKGSRSSEGSEDKDQQNIKQKLYEDITNLLNVDQKKGIIPIVFNMS